MWWKRRGDADRAADVAGEGPSAVHEWAKGLIGQTISHYHITAPLARGKTGYIFHARDTRNDTRCRPEGAAMPDFGLDEKKVQQLRRGDENGDAAQPSAPAENPTAPARPATHCWVATEYIPGDSLAAVIGRIEKTGKLDWKAVVRVGVYLARALEYAHQKELIHQNVTPQNIFVGRKPQNTKLTDLMLALATEEDPTSADLGRGADRRNRCRFMSPERTDGPGAAIDGRTDIYSLAATLYAMLTGKPPFHAATVPKLIEKIRLDSPPACRLQARGCPNAVGEIAAALPGETAARPPRHRRRSAQGTWKRSPRSTRFLCNASPQRKARDGAAPLLALRAGMGTSMPIQLDTALNCLPANRPLRSIWRSSRSSWPAMNFPISTWKPISANCRRWPVKPPPICAAISPIKSRDCAAISSTKWVFAATHAIITIRATAISTRSSNAASASRSACRR